MKPSVVNLDIMDLDVDVEVLAYSLAAFIFMFSTAYLAYPDGKYASDFNITVDEENPSELVIFDDRNITLSYNESSVITGNGRDEELNIEGRQNDIFAVDGNTYMFYFDAGEDYLRLIRIEEL